VPGGFGMRGVEGKIEAIRFARTRNVPFFGICLGMQCATVEFARSILGLDDANSTEFDKTTQHPVIALMEEQLRVRERGGTMRLGAWPCTLAPDSRALAAYGRERIEERHRHRYEFNNTYRAAFEENGFAVTGTSPDGDLVEIIELPDHPWFLAVQFHPEFKSKPTKAHPLFRDFVAAALQRREASRAELEVR
jgi:CTP synthase